MQRANPMVGLAFLCNLNCESVVKCRESVVKSRASVVKCRESVVNSSASVVNAGKSVVKPRSGDNHHSAHMSMHSSSQSSVSLLQVSSS